MKGTNLTRKTSAAAALGFVPSAGTAGGGGGEEDTGFEEEENESGVAIEEGDVVKLLADGTIELADTAQDTGKIGVAIDDIADGASGPVVWAGPVGLIKVTATVAAGTYAETTTTAGEATSNATIRSGSFGQFTTAGIAPAGFLFGGGGGPTSSAGSAGTELDYVQITTGDSSITATTEGTAETLITGTSQAYTAVPIIIEVFFPQARTGSAAAGNTLNFILFDGATVLGQIGEMRTVAASALGVPVLMRCRLTPTAATHQYIVKAYVSAGTALVGAGAGGTAALVAAYIRVTLV